MKKTIAGISLVTSVIMTVGYSRGMSIPDYVKKFKDCAIEQMLVYNIPASVTLAQGILESECGGSPLAVYANNHFGIKCHADWSGPYYVYNDDLPGEHFRKYTNVNDSYKDHARFLKSRPWYGFLFNYPRTDYQDWAFGLSKAGYATATDYAVKLVSIIQQNHLYQYDTVLKNLQGFGILDDDPATFIKQPKADFVYVKPGDCIYKIAREYDVDVDIICHYNGLSIKDKLVPGRKLMLRAKDTQNNQQSDNRNNSSNNREGITTLPVAANRPKW